MSHHVTQAAEWLLLLAVLAVSVPYATENIAELAANPATAPDIPLLAVLLLYSQTQSVMLLIPIGTPAPGHRAT